MATTQYYENRIVNSLAVTDPKMDTSIGTPVRKIITAVAAEISDYDDQETKTTSLYSINSVSGTELEYLVGLFGFARQTAKYARGTITLKRDNPDSLLSIPAGSSFSKPATSTSDAVLFQTTSYSEMAEGIMSVTIPVVATVSGTSGNVAANTIVYGASYGQYTSVTNPEPTTGGMNAESDDELRSRFLLTVFRNEAGTSDQLLGLAYANDDVRRAKIVGKESRYSETVMVKRNLPPVSDVEYYAEPTASLVSAAVTREYIAQNRIWVRDAETSTLFNYGGYTPQYDATGTYPVLSKVVFNGSDMSDVYVVTAASFTRTLSGTSVMYGSVTAEIAGETLSNWYTVTYNADGTATIAFTGLDAYVSANRNIVVSYLNCVAAKGEIVTIEFDYLSKLNRGTEQAVDMYVDAAGYTSASDIQYADASKVITSSNAANWELDDTTNPTANHWYLVFAHQPALTVADTISTGASTLLTKGVHYRIAHDVTVNGYSVAATDIIELIGSAGSPTTEGKSTFVVGSGDDTITIVDGQPMYIEYTYNSDVLAVQNLVNEQSPVTADIEVHGAKTEYYTINMDVMYTLYQRSAIRTAVEDNIRDWAASVPFGSAIQFSDIETVGANTSGVDNVKVTSIQRVTADGSVIGTAKTSDFYIGSSSVFAVYDIVITDKVQQDWSN